jgi:tRNA(Ile)-lysidine synthase TilS/MesJ
LRQISHILRDFKGAEESNDPLYAALKEKCEIWEKGHKVKALERSRHEARQELARMDEQRQNRQKEAAERAQAHKQEQKQARDNTAERAPRRIDLVAAGEGRFLIRLKSEIEMLPARTDWLRWQEAITGQETKPDDIELSLRGLAVKFNDEAVLEHLKQNAAKTKGWTSAILPNDRAGVDLNQFASGCFMGRDL